MATLTPANTTGTGVNFVADSAIFKAADAGRIIIANNGGRATVTGVSGGDPSTTAIADVTTDFPNTDVIASGDWRLSVRLTPSATTGDDVTFTADEAIFLEGDVERYIIVGASRAIIKTFGTPGNSSSPNVAVRGNILEDFSSTNPIPDGDWLLRLSPHAGLQVDHREPVGLQIAMTFSTPTLRNSDLNKYVLVYGGVIKIIKIASATSATGEIVEILADSDKLDPDEAPAGSWTLEVPAWSNTRGWPRAIEFHQGRLVFAGTDSEPTTVWGSRSNDYYNFGRGSLANSSYKYELANRSVNIISWLQSLKNLFIGSAEAEQFLKGRGIDAPIGGEEIPYLSDEGASGSLNTMAVVIHRSILFIQAFKRKVIELSYDYAKDGFVATNLTLFSRHIAGPSGFTRHVPVVQGEPNSFVHFIRNDGEVASLTYYPQEQVAGWSRIMTSGQILSLAVIPNAERLSYELWQVVKRGDKIWQEVYDSVPAQTINRAWREPYTDSCCFVEVNGTSNEVTLPDLYEPGEEVDVVYHSNDFGTGRYGSYLGRFVVDGSNKITLQDSYSDNRVFEIGLPYTSTLMTLRPALKDTVVDGLKRRWVNVFLRLMDSIGARVNGYDMVFTTSTQALDQGPPLFAGDKQIGSFGWDMEGYVTVEHDQPYPLKILALYGEVEFADKMG